MKKFLSPVASTFIKQKQITCLPIHLHVPKTSITSFSIGKRFYAKRIKRSQGPRIPPNPSIQSTLPVLNPGQISSGDIQKLLIERTLKKEEARGNPEKYRHLSYSLFRGMASYSNWLIPVMHEQKSETIQSLKKDSEMVIISEDVNKKRILPIFTSMECYENCKRLQNDKFGKSVEKLDNIAALAPGLDEIIVDMGSPHEFVLPTQFVQVLPSWKASSIIEQILHELQIMNNNVVIQLEEGDKQGAKATIREMYRRNFFGLVKKYNPFFIISMGADPTVENGHILGLAPNEHGVELAAVFTAPDTALEYTRIMSLDREVIYPVTGEFLFSTIEQFDTISGICFNRFNENPNAMNREMIVTRDFINLVNDA